MPPPACREPLILERNKGFGGCRLSHHSNLACDFKRILAGLEEPSSGQVRVFGQPLRGLNTRAGYMFQTESLMPWRTALANVMAGLEFRGVAPAQARQQAEDWLKRVGLGGFGDRYPHQLSGGMRKRTSLAQTLALVPGVSRSGSTLTASLLDGWNRADAARFSFLLGIPAITIAGLVELKDAFAQPLVGGALPLLVGIASAALVSWLAIAWLLRFLQQHSTWWFVGYRLFFGLGLILCANRLAG